MISEIRPREIFSKGKRGALGGALRMAKYQANTKCPKCDLVFRDGLWKKGRHDRRQELHLQLCPACHRIQDGHPGGLIECSGKFVGSHRQDLMNRIRNIERQASEEHPLERIISIKEGKTDITVAATNEHLIARIGKALERDYGGNLELKYSPEDKFAAAHWHRDN
jgi:hypothetical protein